MSSTTTPIVNLNKELSTALSVILPVIYSLIALIGISGNLVLLQSICANRFRHKSIHLLILSILVSDLCFIIIFTIVHAVSYGYLSTGWFTSPGDWCKAELYLLHIFDFALAYSIVFMCLDRAVGVDSCWSGVRKFRSGISIVISVWVASAYVLIPILLFKQTVYTESYGGYFCVSTDQSVPLYWLGTFPRRVLDFIDIVFRTFLPICFMFVLLLAASVNMCVWNSRRLGYDQPPRINSKTAHRNNINANSAVVLNSAYLNSMEDERTVRYYHNRLYSMVLSYALIFAFCQLPYEIYRAILLCDIDLESYLWRQNLDFSIEIPLLLLKLINRCINPFLYICLGDVFGFSRRCCRLWCCPCLPGCIGCRKCWCYDCYETVKYETSYCLGKRAYGNANENEYVPTGLQTVSTYQYKDGERLVTKQKIIEEYETGVPAFYKNPKMRELYEERGGIVNQTFENDDIYKVATIGRHNQSAVSNDRLRIKF
jgi:hypothetical protein